MSTSVRTCVAVLAVLATSLVGVTVASTADAAGGPSVTWSFAKSSVNAQSKVTIEYSTMRIGRSDVVRVERRMGSQQVWGRVKTLKGRGSATAKVTAPAMGSYAYRIAVYRPRDGMLRLVWASGTRSLMSYGRVPMGVLCNKATAAYICGTEFKETADVGDMTFTYVGQTNGFSAAQPPDWDLLFQFPKTSCRKITVRFAVDGPATDDSSNLQVIQGRTDAQGGSTPNGTIGRLTAKLDGSAFTVRANNTDGDSILGNGFARCLTANGKA